MTKFERKVRFGQFILKIILLMSRKGCYLGIDFISSGRKRKMETKIELTPIFKGFLKMALVQTLAMFSSVLESLESS